MFSSQMCFLVGKIVGYNYEFCEIQSIDDYGYTLQRLNQETREFLDGDVYTKVSKEDLSKWCILGNDVLYMEKTGELEQEEPNGSVHMFVHCSAVTI